MLRLFFSALLFDKVILNLPQNGRLFLASYGKLLAI